ncbi:hypothetical protein UlMin_037413 [Ulmus minor]
MVACKLCNFNFGTLSPQFNSFTKHRWTQNSNSNWVVFSAIDGPRWSSSGPHYSPKYYKENRSMKKKQRKLEEEDDDDEEGGKRKVHCEVELVSWRERRIKAEIPVHADVESIWNALTDYERLADFVPNLVSSGRIPCPFPGRIWLEQRGFQRALNWHIEARVLKEITNSDFNRELQFSVVDGDFKKFEGKWSVKCGTRSSSSILSYEVSVIPRFNVPAIFLERIIRPDLPVNLQASASRDETSFGRNHNMVITENSLGATFSAVSSSFQPNTDMDFGPLNPSSSVSNRKLGILGKARSLDRHCMVDKVHLRRFDGLLESGGVHRCVVASITVKAPIREVWNVLIAYESLPETETQILSLHFFCIMHFFYGINKKLLILKVNYTISSKKISKEDILKEENCFVIDVLSLMCGQTTFSQASLKHVNLNIFLTCKFLEV